MTPQELLKPRFEVIADYPGMENDQIYVGDIIRPYDMGFMYPDKVEERYRDYPHLFRRLHWAEKRDEKDLPEYVKTVRGVKKVKSYSLGGHKPYFISADVDGCLYYLNKCQPSSLEEYTLYINSLK